VLPLSRSRPSRPLSTPAATTSATPSFVGGSCHALRSASSPRCGTPPRWAPAAPSARWRSPRPPGSVSSLYGLDPALRTWRWALKQAMASHRLPSSAEASVYSGVWHRSSRRRPGSTHESGRRLIVRPLAGGGRIGRGWTGGGELGVGGGSGGEEAVGGAYGGGSHEGGCGRGGRAWIGRPAARLVAVLSEAAGPLASRPTVAPAESTRRPSGPSPTGERRATGWSTRTRAVGDDRSRPRVESPLTIQRGVRDKRDPWEVVMPVRGNVREAQRRLAALDAAYNTAVVRRDRAVEQRTRLVAEQDALVRVREVDVEQAVGAMAVEVGVGLTSQLLGVDVALVRRTAREVKGPDPRARSARGANDCVARGALAPATAAPSSAAAVARARGVEL
jgi:hypothetical protein